MRKKNTRRKKKSAKKSLKRPLLRFTVIGLLVLLVVTGLGLLWLDYDVRQRFESHEWVLPARVYARPEDLYRGRILQAEHLVSLLQLMRYRVSSQVGSPGSYYHSGNRFVIYTRGFSDTDGGEKPMRLVLTLANNKIASLTDSQGHAVPVARLEPLQIGSIHPGFQEDRIYVELDDVPPMLVKLLLATEDRRFYQHHGVSFRGLARALWVDVMSGSLAQGGSTLTQQLVKNLWLTNRRSIWRKLAELPMAMLLELHYSKEEILNAYLNEAYLGQDGGRAIHGVGLASQFYFGQSLKELTTPQLAMLVGLLKGPSWYDPRRSLERATVRRNQVMQNTVAVGDMSPDDYKKLSQETLEVVPRGKSALYAFPAFIDLVKRQLKRDFSGDVLSRDGLKIHSTLDVLAQLAAEKSLTEFTDRVDPSGKRGLNGAVVVIDPNQGDVLALVGDRNPHRAGYNRALDASRSIGSLVKPFVLLSALASEDYTLATLVPDEPITVDLAKGKTWSPENFDHKSLGPIPLLQALVDSRNQATVQVGMEVTPKKVVDTMQRLGLSKKIAPYPSILLGGFELTPLQVAMLYQPLSNGGFQTPVRSITDVLDHHGEPLVRYPADSNQVLSASLAYLTEWAMQKVVSDGTGRYAGGLLPQLQLAGKSGTSNDLRDSWFAGFSGSSLAVVWLGQDDNSSTGLTGSSGALRVWEPIMAKIPQQPLRLRLPKGVSMAWMNPDGEHGSEPECEDSIEYPMLDATLPEDIVSCRQHDSFLDRLGSPFERFRQPKKEEAPQKQQKQHGVMKWFKGIFGH